MREIHYTPNRESWAAFLRHELATEPWIRKTERRVMLASWIQTTLLLPVFLTVFWLGLRNRGSGELAALILGPIVWLLYAMFVMQSVPKSFISRQARDMNSGKTPFPEVRCAIRIHPEGVTIDQPTPPFTLSWPWFTRILRLPEAVILEHHDYYQSIIIPAESFESPDAADAFVAEVRSLQSAAGADETAQLIKQLHDHNRSCPACGYALRGLASPKCPECGQVITPTTLRCIDILEKPFWRLLTRTPK